MPKQYNILNEVNRADRLAVIRDKRYDMPSVVDVILAILGVVATFSLIYLVAIMF